MPEDKNDTVLWLAEAIQNKPYSGSTWYRCPGIQDFVEKVQEKFVIVGVTFSGNNLGFILDKKN